MWKPIVLAFDEMRAEPMRGDMKIKVDEIRKKMTTMKTYFGVHICSVLFSPCEEHAKGLQSKNTTATGALESARILIAHLKRIREENEFNRLYDQCINDAIDLNLQLPKERRTLQPPTKYEAKPNSSKAHVFTAKEKLRQEYFSAADMLIAEVERRFDQPGLKQMAKLEHTLFTTINSAKTICLDTSNLSAKIDVICAIYTHIHRDKLKCQLLMLPDLIKDCAHPPVNVVELASFFIV
jgi:hypothetical protein